MIRRTFLGRRGLGGTVERSAQRLFQGLLRRLPKPPAQAADSKNFRAILLLRIDRVGDMIVSTPTIRAIRKRHPEAEIRIIASKANAAVLAGNPDLNGVHILRAAELPALTRLLLRRWDVVADLNTGPSMSSGLLARLARASSRVSFEKKNADLFYDVRLHSNERGHRAAETMRIARWMGAADEDLRYRLHPSEENEREAEEALRQAGWSPGASWVAAHPGNIKKFDNRWPEEKFAELCGRIRSKLGTEVLLLQGFDEAPLIERVLADCPTELKVLPPLPLLATASVLSRMRLVLCNSTSTLHMAAAVGTPSLSFLSGYSAQCWNAPGAQHRALVDSEWNSCRSIPVEDAWKAVQEML